MTPELELRIVRQQLRAVQADNAQLRKRLHESTRHARRVKQAYQDSLMLVSLRVGGITPSVRYAEAHGMSRRRWQNAMGLLRQAGIVNHAPGYTWLITNGADTEWRLDYARDLSVREPEIYAANLCGHANHDWERVPRDGA